MGLALLTSAIVMSAYWLGKQVGQYQERKEWDELIRSGKLPRPGQQWTPVPPYRGIMQEISDEWTQRN